MAEHHHHHEEGAAEAQPAFDVAGQYLANAFRTSFHILTFIIVILVILFLSKGIFTVQADQLAIILRFGATDPGLVKPRGFAYAFPYPIDEVVRIWTNSDTLEVNTFWPLVTEESREAAVQKGEEIVPIEGAENALILTGDLNMLQSRWKVTYNVKDDAQSVIQYYKKVGNKENEKKLIRHAVENAIIHELAKLKVFDAYPRNEATALPDMVKGQVEKTLRNLDCGLAIATDKGLNLEDIRPPANVKASFDRVLAAQQEASQVVTDAQSRADQMLIKTAGQTGIRLGEAIDEWWDAKAAKDTERMAEVERLIQSLYSDAGGEVRTILASANAYATTVEQEAKGDAELLSFLLTETTDEQKQIYVEVERIKALSQVLAGAFEVYLYRPAQGGTRPTLEIEINRHPELLREMQKVR